MSENHAEIAVIENAAPVAGLGNELANLTAGRVAGYSSITDTSFDGRVAVITALSTSVPVADNLGKTINLANVVIESVTLANERTGELQEVPRITFLDADGTAYSATSDVLFKDIKRVFAILGTPNTWPAPVPVKVTKEKAKVGSFFTLSIVSGK